MKSINSEYTELFNELKNIHINSNGEKYHTKTNETPEQLIELMDRLNKAQKWVDAAEDDLTNAECLAQTMDSENAFRILWSYCNKAAKKYLKALIVFKLKKLPEVNDLMELFEICEEYAKIDLACIYRECENLAGYDDGYTAKANNAEQAVKDTERIRYFVTSYLDEFLIGKNFEIYFIKE